MPREARLIMERACYHVMNRGNQKQNIVVEKTDYEKYLAIEEQLHELDTDSFQVYL